MAGTRAIRFRINLTAEQYLAYYRGEAKEVVVRAEDGRNLRFPANVLRPYLTRNGIRGDFVMEYDERNRFVAIRQLTLGQ